MWHNIENFISGFLLPLKGARLLLTSKKTKRWAMLPLIVNFIIYIFLVLIFMWLVAKIQIPQLDWEFWGGTGAWISSIVNSLSGVLKWTLALPLVFILCYFTFSIVGMVVAAPFNDILSEKLEDFICAEKQITDEEPERPLRLDLKAMGISISSSFKFAAKQIFFSTLVLPLLLIPFVGATALFLVSAYYAGIGFLDVGMARNYLPHNCKLPAINQHRWKIIGLGAGMEVLFMIPLAGLLMLPLGVAGGTDLYCSIDWQRLLENDNFGMPEGFVPPKKR